MIIIIKVIIKLIMRFNFVQLIFWLDDCKVCFEYNFKYIIDNEYICDIGNGKSNVDIVVFIFIVYVNRKVRDILREIWLIFIKNNIVEIRYVFLLGFILD